MGDRANVQVVMPSENGKGKTSVYLYTHWNGSELPEVLRQALIRGKPRWQDDSYLTRIIFSEMIRDNVLDETGYGISPFICDGNYRILVVEPGSGAKSGTVKIKLNGKVTRTFTFNEYVAQSAASWGGEEGEEDDEE